MWKRRIGFMCALCVLGMTVSAFGQTLVHQYTFEDGTPNDSVGGAHGTLWGGKIECGALILAGSGQYMEMDGPTIAINSYPQITLEVWAMQSVRGVHSWTVGLGSVWDNGLGKDYIMITTTRLDGAHRGAICNTPDSDAPWGDEVGVSNPELYDGRMHHYVLTVTDSQLAYYVDGALIDTAPMNGTRISGLSNDYVYLGKSLYYWDAPWTGMIEEFNIYNGALSAGDVANHFDAGPVAGPGADFVSNPSPADRAECVPIDTALSWLTGDCVVSQELYFGRTEADVLTATTDSPEYYGPIAGNAFDRGMLDWCMEYYWRIDIKKPSGIVVKGPVWGFKTWCDDCNEVSAEKWPQPPVTDGNCVYGWDERSDYNWAPIVADDWKCTDNRPVTAVRWWGSFLEWRGSEVPACRPRGFHLGIWTDTPVPDSIDPNDPNAFSHPNQLVWERMCGWEEVAVTYVGPELDPTGNGRDDGCFRFEYEIADSNDWFRQDPCSTAQGTVYWLSIAALYDEPNACDHPWGWTTREHIFNDDAVRIFPPTATCPNECDVMQEQQWTFSGSSVSSGQWVSDSRGSRGFSDARVNGVFKYRIDDLPPCIERATLRIGLTALSNAPWTDSIGLQVTGGATLPNRWSRYLGRLGTDPGLTFPGSVWGQPLTSAWTGTLNLGGLPRASGGTANLVPALREQRNLTVTVQDDTMVDFVELTLWCCPLEVGQWPPRLWDFYDNGEPIEEPNGVSWDTTFVLITRPCEPPTPATDPIPEDGELCAVIWDGQRELCWTPGRRVESQTVYVWDADNTLIWSDEDLPPDVNHTTVTGLEMCRTYFWQVVEFGCDEWVEGDIWMFSTSDGSPFSEPSQPQPTDGKDCVDPPVTLSWSSGCCTCGYQVEIGESPGALQRAHSFPQWYFNASAGGRLSFQVKQTLKPCTWYYWRVNEMRAEGNIAGPIWRFRMCPDPNDPNCAGSCAVIDDMESYDDNCQRIYYMWHDGVGHPGSAACGVAPHSGNGTPALVAKPFPPYAGQAPEPVHGGVQSLPLTFNNTAAQYSEISRSLTGPLSDWATMSAGYANPTLVIWHTNLPASNDRLYVRIDGYKAYQTSSQPALWSCFCVPLLDTGLNLMNVRTLCIGMEREDPSLPGGEGTIYIDDIEICAGCPCQ